jgi:FtsP/CotA-like multicopper oxidase with cupredoxin domain
LNTQIRDLPAIVDISRSFSKKTCATHRVESGLRLSLLLLFSVGLGPHCFIWAESEPGTRSSIPRRETCERAPEGSLATGPTDLRSMKGILKVSLRVRSALDAFGHTRYCYIDEHGNEAPTLRVQPGDTLKITLRNEISIPETTSSSPGASAPPAMNHVTSLKRDPCTGGVMGPAATNLHFHGLSIPPVCHQDDTLKTLVEPGDPPFEYRVQVPNNQAPGLYWYHPHVHGYTEDQVLGGASGAIIVEGMERSVPRVAGLPERVLVIRDEKMPEPSAAEKADLNRPTKQLSINYVPVPYPNYPPAIIKMKPLKQQFWRVLNASADTYLDLSIDFGGKRQSLGIVALDGVPLRYGEPGAANYAPQQTHIFLPPASRAEFIVTGPPQGVSGRLVTNYVYRGAADDDKPLVARSSTQPALRVGLDDVDAARPLASIVPAEVDSVPLIHRASVTPALPRALLSSVRPVRKRTLYFSEKLVDSADPNSATLFFITEEGHPPAVFDPHSSESTITVRQGDVEDWTIENRSRESHAFHIHQMHFIAVGGRTMRWEELTLRDTIDLPAWDGFRKYPSVILRMDFRDPRIVGTFPFHCHIMQHVDGGMMGVVRVESARKERAH